MLASLSLQSHARTHAPGLSSCFSTSIRVTLSATYAPVANHIRCTHITSWVVHVVCISWRHCMLYATYSLSRAALGSSARTARQSTYLCRAMPIISRGFHRVDVHGLPQRLLDGVHVPVGDDGPRLVQALRRHIQGTSQGTTSSTVLLCGDRRRRYAPPCGVSLGRPPETHMPWTHRTLPWSRY